MATLEVKIGANAKFPQVRYAPNPPADGSPWEFKPAARCWMTLEAGQEQIDIDLGWADDPTGTERAAAFAAALGMTQVGSHTWSTSF